VEKFWTGFEKSANIFGWGKDALKAAPVIEHAVKPGLFETVKNIAGDASDIAGKIKSHLEGEDVQKVIHNASNFTTDVKNTAKLLKWPLVGLSVAATAGTVASVPQKMMARKASKEELKYFQNMNRQFDEKK
jgi:hypothetical protein